MFFSRLILFFLCTLTFAHAHASFLDETDMEPLRSFFDSEGIAPSHRPTVAEINKSALPEPAAYLLTQSLLTAGITHYYQRTPQLRSPIHVEDDLKNQRYSRGIIMVVDNNKKRNDALLADKINESTIVELGLISINFAALPETIIEEVRKGQTPLGALLLMHHVKTDSINTRYFKITCTEPLTRYLACKSGEILYGRSNTLVRDDNHVWVAEVVEILTSKQL